MRASLLLQPAQLVDGRGPAQSLDQFADQFRRQRLGQVGPEGGERLDLLLAGQGAVQQQGGQALVQDRVVPAMGQAAQGQQAGGRFGMAGQPGKDAARPGADQRRQGGGDRIAPPFRHACQGGGQQPGQEVVAALAVLITGQKEQRLPGFLAGPGGQQVVEDGLQGVLQRAADAAIGE